MKASGKGRLFDGVTDLGQMCNFIQPLSFVFFFLFFLKKIIINSITRFLWDLNKCNLPYVNRQLNKVSRQLNARQAFEILILLL